MTLFFCHHLTAAMATTFHHHAWTPGVSRLLLDQWCLLSFAARFQSFGDACPRTKYCRSLGAHQTRHHKFMLQIYTELPSNTILIVKGSGEGVAGDSK